MQPLDPDHLPAMTCGFLTEATRRAVGPAALIEGGFDQTRFDDALFDQLGIQRPASLGRAIDKRLAEFLAGRTMARLAQEALGHAAQQVRIGSDRAPIWPSGVSGSISHARGRCACLALPSNVAAPGIDIEVVAEGHALKSILRLTVNADEAALIQTSPDPAQTATLCFSAKEALFKALFPTVRRHFGFSSAVLRELPCDGALRLRLTETLHPTLPEGMSFNIRFEAGRDQVLTWLLHQLPADKTGTISS